MVVIAENFILKVECEDFWLRSKKECSEAVDDERRRWGEKQAFYRKKVMVAQISNVHKQPDHSMQGQCGYVKSLCCV